MNKIHCSVWNAALGTWVAVSELSRRRGRSASSTVAAATCLLALANLPGSAWAQAAGGGAAMVGGGTGGRGGVGNGGGAGGGNIGMYPTSNGQAPTAGTGGAGGNGAAGAGGTGGAVGATSVTGSVSGASGTDGVADPDPVYGAGGGGGGGAAVYTSDTAITATSGTILLGGNGGNGGAGRLSGGGGGGGAGLQSVAANATVSNAGQMTGGQGGAGSPGQWAGGGGGGGDGMVLQGGGATVTNSGTATGGRGGDGGTSFAGLHGGGGEGGAGLALESSGNSVLNTGALVGGAGGAGGSSAVNGIGGAGLRIRGNTNTIVNTGTLTGGLAGDGTTRGDAVRITGNDNSLELQNGSVITGTLTANGTGNLLRLSGALGGGTTSLAAATYRGFDRYEKTGTSTWTLTGTTTELTPWNVLGGTLAIADDGALGNSAGTLTLDGGTLRATGTTTGTRNVTLGAGGAAFEVDSAQALRLNGVLSGSGSLQKTGAGTLVLGGVNSYSGGTLVSTGLLQAATTGALGSGAVTVNGALEFLDGVDAQALTITNQNGFTTFRGASTAGQSLITNNNASGTDFYGTSSGGTSTIINNQSGFTYFRETTSSADAHIVNNGGGAATFFIQNGSAGNAVIDNNGGQARFYDSSTAGSATITNRSGGVTYFIGSSSADSATLVNDGNGRVDASYHTGALSIGALSGQGRLLLGANAVSLGAGGRDSQFAGTVEDGGENGGTGGSLVKVGTGTLTLSGANTYTGGTALKQGRLDLGHSQALGTGTLAMDDGTTLGFSADGLTIANAIELTGSNDPVIDTGAFSETLSGAITGGGFITKQGSGTLTLTGANTYTGATNVAQGTLRAGAANTFSASSAHSVAAGATLDLAGFSQTVASLANSGTVSLIGTTPGTTLTVNGPYAGNNGVLRLGTALGADGSASDRLVLDGSTAIASGSTTVQIVNLSGLGALTSGNGIEVISARNGATTTAQTTKSAFSLAGSHVDAGAYEYRLHAADANGAGENWYLRSTTNVVPPVDPVTPVTPVTPPATPPVVVPTYRAEASLYAALPSQLRQGSLAMLGDLRKRVGDDDVKGTAAMPAGGSGRRAWARVLSTDLDIQQGGTVSPTSKGRLTGVQAGTDLLATPNWRAGLYVGQLDGDAKVSGFASGLQNLRVGRNDLRSQYVGIYGTYSGDSGFYADAVVQSGRHRYTVQPNLGGGVEGKGHSLLGSVEVGQAFALGASGWSVEPQLQLIHQHLDLNNSAIVGAVVEPEADSGWIARAGLRVKGEFGTGLGTLQPYGRFNVYRNSSGADVARFVNGATRTDIVAPTGGTSTELAGGFTLALGSATSLYGEVGKLWSSGGDAKVKSSVNASLGVRMKW
ncbi:autotransporter outer membrane beta-barrel domain-containing protein [Variovorax sp. VRV01]|uniref:autotransporter outer membrane beta-barrel domain-containing protein n=1 Tax=Variovorax sp. VRV01 TaxID=2769259 RepID=UPI001782D318|nr:autotransporter outer membrane beta-barrel domain-containing protein [Variovorax sp. VRV01]MBD9665368.1 autotransporter outer membrane beta-barrel domain-containing protein [Variovorax sp. VRV01]